MRAIRYLGGYDPVAIEHIDDPEPGPDEVKVRVRAASICGSDVHLLNGEGAPGDPPMTLGHEGAGVVETVGNDVKRVEPGDHVVINYIRSCGDCRPCLKGADNACRNRVSVGHSADGTFAEYIVTPARDAFPISSDVPLEWGSVAACGVATAYHAVTESEMDPGDVTVVFGVGGVGTHAVMWADFFGAGTIVAVDVNDAKLQNAEKYGADLTVNPTEVDVDEVVNRVSDGWGADVVVECSGSAPALKDGLGVIHGANRFETGNVVVVGKHTEPFETDFYGLLGGNLSVSLGHTREELRQIVRLLETGRVDLSHSVSHRLPLNEFERGVELMRKNEEDVRRIILEP